MNIGKTKALIAATLFVASGMEAAQITLEPDADVDIRSADLAYIGQDHAELYIANLNPDPSAARDGKAYVRFKLPSDFGTALNATFTMDRTRVGAWNFTYEVSGLNDGAAGEERWLEKDGTGMNWNGAPGNITTSSTAFTNATLVGTFTVSNAVHGGVTGDRWSISGSDLVNFLNADSNGYVTLMVGRINQSTGYDLFASKENTSYAAPELTLEYTKNSLVSVALVPDADATIKYDSANSNFGSDAVLAIKSATYGEYDPGCKSYLRFELPAGQAGSIMDAKLILVRSEVAPWQYDVDLYGLHDDITGQSWSESGLTWNNAPGNDLLSNYWDPAHADHLFSVVLNGSNGGGYAGEKVALGSLPWVASDLVKFLNADTDGVVNLLLTTGFTESYQNSFASKENTNYEAPTLVLTYSTDTNAPECNGSFKSPGNELATARWNHWRKDQEKFPTAGWDFIDTNTYGTNAYQLYADAGFSMIRVREANYSYAVDAGLKVIFGWWDQLHQDPAKLADYMSFPASEDPHVIGYFLDDEPSADQADECGARSMEVYAQDSRNAIPMVNHNLPIQELLKHDIPAYLLRTRYSLLTDGSTRPNFYGNLEEIRKAGLAYDIGTMGWVLTTKHDSGSTHYRQASESDVFWQVYSILGYGGQGVWYYHYDIDPDGGSFLDAYDHPNALYYYVQAANAELDNLWPVFKHLRSVGVFHSRDNPENGIEGAENLGAGWNVEVYKNGDIGALETFSGDNFLLGELENRDDTTDSSVYVLIQNKRHAMDAASADLAATCSFSVSSNYPVVSVIDPLTGDDVYLGAKKGTHSLSLGGGKGALVRLASKMPSVLSLLPLCDTYIQKGKPATDFGSSTNLIAQNSSLFPDRDRKIYMKYALPVNGTAADGVSLEITPSGIYNKSWDWKYEIYGLKDEAPGNNWHSITWSNAPANDTGSGTAFTLDATALLGQITGGGSAGESRVVTSQALVDFVQADQDGVVTLMMVRDNDSTAHDTWASTKSVGFPQPKLTLSYSPAVIWALQHGLAGTDTGVDADPDGDLANNLFEFAFGGDPTSATLFGYPVDGGVACNGGSNWIELTYLRRKDPASGLMYEIEKSTNLVSGDWMPVVSAEVGISNLDDSYEFVTNRIEMKGTRSGFLRVKAKEEK